MHPFTLRKLGHRMGVGIDQNTAELFSWRLESGSFAVGARAMHDDRLFVRFSREQVELFAVNHLIMMEINCSDEALMMDFSPPYN